MNIEALLQAAEYLDRRDKESEHCYASSPLYSPPPSLLNHELDLESDGSAKYNQNRKKMTRLRKTQGSRSTHNELEKNRRAHLRECLQSLKKIVPIGSESTRHTTLGLLTKAKHFIRTLEDKDRKVLLHKEHLLREQRYLKRKLSLLSSQFVAMNKKRSLSECSMTSTASGSSNSETDEHEVDVIGYGGTCDDDNFKIGENETLAVTTWRHIGITGEPL